MGKTPVYYDFSEGGITQNLIDLLNTVPVDTLFGLIDTGDLNAIRNSDLPVKRQSLRFQGITAYSKVLGVNPLRLFYLKGNAHPSYTEFDKQVLDDIKQIPILQLSHYEPFFQRFFDTSLYHSRNDVYERLSKLYGYRVGWAKEIKGKGSSINPVRKEIADELARYKSLRIDMRSKMRFKTDYLPEIAEALGVSLHWLFHCGVPMFTDSQCGDRLFDLYTLLSKEDQQMFISIMHELAEPYRSGEEGSQV